MLKRLSSTPNLISLFRLFLAVPLAYLIYQSNTLLVIIVGILVFVSDYLDGYLARKYNDVSETGKKVDPLADKVVVILAIIALVASDKSPLWFAVAVISRDVLILIGGLILQRIMKGFTLPSNMLGKLTVNVLSIVFFLQYLGYGYHTGSFIGTFFLILSFGFYLVRAIRYAKSPSK